jgi:hypothetical protein
MMDLQILAMNRILGTATHRVVILFREEDYTV